MTTSIGAADNGKIVYVDLPGYAGPAGFRQRTGWAEIAFFGEVDVPAGTFTVDGREAKALRAVPSENAGVMTVLAVAFA